MKEFVDKFVDKFPIFKNLFLGGDDVTDQQLLMLSEGLFSDEFSIEDYPEINSFIADQFEVTVIKGQEYQMPPN